MGISLPCMLPEASAEEMFSLTFSSHLMFGFGTVSSHQSQELVALRLNIDPVRAYQ